MVVSILGSSIDDDVAHDTKNGLIARAQEGINTSGSFAFAFACTFPFAYLRYCVRAIYIYICIGDRCTAVVCLLSFWTAQLPPPFLFAPPPFRRLCCAPAEYAPAYSPGFGHAAGCLPGSLCLGRRTSLISNRRAVPMGSALRWREGCRLRSSVPSFVGWLLLTHSLAHSHIYIYNNIVNCLLPIYNNCQPLTETFNR